MKICTNRELPMFGVLKAINEAVRQHGEDHIADSALFANHISVKVTNADGVKIYDHFYEQEGGEK